MILSVIEQLYTDILGGHVLKADYLSALWYSSGPVQSSSCGFSLLCRDHLGCTSFWTDWQGKLSLAPFSGMYGHTSLSLLNLFTATTM